MLRRRLILGLVVALVALVALVATGCGGGDDEATAPTASPPDAVTGVAEVDAVINVVLSGDVEALRQLMLYTQVPCEADPEVPSASPRCHPDEPDGTLVDAFSVDYYGSGPVVRADQIDRTLDNLMEPRNEVYAVYGAWKKTFPPIGGTWRDRLPDEYVVVFSQDLAERGVFGRSVTVAAGRVVRIDLGGGHSPEFLIPRGPAPPLYMIEPPTGRCRAAPELVSTSTGIPEVDGVIDATLSGDLDRLLDMVRYTPAPCERSTGSDGLAPTCRSEPDGTLVDTLPIADCRARYMRAEDVRRSLGEILALDLGLYAVYRVPPSYWPAGEYVVAFSKSETEWGCEVGVEQFVVAEGQVVGAVLSCGDMPQQAVRSVPPEDFVLAPPTPTPVPTPAGTPTPVLPYWERNPALAEAVGLYVLDEDGEQRRIVDLPATTLRWSLDGQRVYFVGAGSGYTGYGVYSVRPDGSELTKVLEASGEGYEFSPDLSRVAYKEFEQPSGWTVRVADLADPASDRKLTDGFLESWSPDGKLIAYFYRVCEPPYAYWVTDLTGGEPRRVIVVTDNVLVSWFTWLPDGKRIAYRTLIRGEDGLEPGEAYAIDLETLAWSYLPELAFVSSRPLFSADGQWFVYEGDEGLMLARWGEQSGKLIAGKGRTAVWSPGSDKIAILGKNQVIFYHLADGQSKVVDLRSLEPMVGWLPLNASWSPAGNELALTVSLGGGHGVCD